MASFLPPPLDDGAKIGIFAPSRWAEPAWLESTARFFASHGSEVVLHPQCFLKQGRLGGSENERASALMDLFRDPAIGAIMCARGGSGSLGILDKLDYGAIRDNPKPLVGFSDVTALLHAIHTQTGMVTFHGPITRTLGLDHDPRVESDLLAMLRQSSKSLAFPEAKTVVSGEAEGPLIGGNLMLLQTLIGTPYDWDTTDSVLFIEDVAEEFYALDRALTHLRLAGKLAQVRAVLVGEMVDVRDDPADPYGGTIEQIVRRHIPVHIPLAFNVPCGHGKYLSTFPVGAQVHVAMNAEGVRLTLRP